MEGGCPLVVHYWTDLQSAHGFRCYDSITANAKCQRVLVLAHVPGLPIVNVCGSFLNFVNKFHNGCDVITASSIQRNMAAIILIG